MKFIVTIILSLLSACPLFATSGLDPLLGELDQVIEQEKEYTSIKEIYLVRLKDRLAGSSLPVEDRYFIYLNLAREYEVYKCDSAIVYSQRAIAAAQSAGNVKWDNDARIQWARSEAKAGMFAHAVDILGSANRSIIAGQQQVEYYKAYIDCYIYWIEYQDGYNLDDLLEKRGAYQDSLLRIVQPGTYDYVVNSGLRYIQDNDLENAEKLLTSYLPEVRPDSREMASVTSILSDIYRRRNDYKRQKEYLAMSAIADIRASVKENVSLRALAVLLFEAGDIRRANRYIKKSLDDANFYNARLRNIQTSKVLPIIDKAYQMDRERQQRKLGKLLVMVSVLSLVLLAAIVFVVMQMKRLSRANRYIEMANARLSNLNLNLQKASDKQTNVHLAEANHIKELFIGNFLDICTEYIEKLRHFKQTVSRKLKAGQSTDLLRLTSNAEGSMQELRELYADFDKAFLNIYPSFVEELNALLRPEERYGANEDGSLNQELRVFAFIRLGIKDTQKIATFLNYTPRTVYNYRSKVKSKALNADEDFEERVKQIGSDHF